MKKAITGIALLAGVAAVAAYALKKNEQKKIMKLDEGLLYDDDMPAVEPTTVNSIQLDEEESEEGEEGEEEPADLLQVKHALKDERYSNLTTDEVKHIEQEHHRLVEELIKEGDHNEVDRPIQHFIHFNHQEDADAFRKVVVNKGFVVSKGEGDFDLVVLHISPVDQIKLVTNELFLADQAYAHHGKYKGWHARVSEA